MGDPYDFDLSFLDSGNSENDNANLPVEVSESYYSKQFSEVQGNFYSINSSVHYEGTAQMGEFNYVPEFSEVYYNVGAFENNLPISFVGNFQNLSRMECLNNYVNFSRSLLSWRKFRIEIYSESFRNLYPKKKQFHSDQIRRNFSIRINPRPIENQSKLVIRMNLINPINQN